MLRTIIIEDEEQKRFTLRQMLTELRPDVKIVGEATDVSSGKQLIKKTNPDLVRELEQKLADWEKDVNNRVKSSPE